MLFNDIFDSVCVKKDLKCNVAELGYKFKGQLKGDLCNKLSTAQDLDDLFQKAIYKEEWMHCRVCACSR